MTCTRFREFILSDRLYHRTYTSVERFQFSKQLVPFFCRDSPTPLCIIITLRTFPNDPEPRYLSTRNSLESLDWYLRSLGILNCEMSWSASSSVSSPGSRPAPDPDTRRSRVHGSRRIAELTNSCSSSCRAVHLRSSKQNRTGK